MPKAVTGLVAAAVLVAVLALAPWPVYKSSRYESRGYYRDAVAALAAQGAGGSRAAPSVLLGGWASVPIGVPFGTPLAGYGARRSRPSTGWHDPLYVKALALSDGVDAAVICGSDLLIVPENVARAVRKKVGARVDLEPRQILFNASHTHSGPGGAARGFLTRFFGGPYSRAVERALIDAFSEAIVAAWQNLEPVEVGTFRRSVPEYIGNRTRGESRVGALVDDWLWGLVARKANGERCTVVRYSAHATVIGAESFAFSGDYPGALQRSLEKTDGPRSMALYLGGAVGSMGPRPPQGDDDFGRAQAMGEALAAVVRGAREGLVFADRLAIEARGVPLTVPPLQVRIAPGWRFSPVVVRLFGIDRSAWLSGVRIGSTVLLGFPADLSGETAVRLAAEGEKRGLVLVPLSFAGDYVGYISPDVYYPEVRTPRGGLAYETGLMSWAGPEQEAFFLDLARKLLDTFPPGR